MGCTEHCRRRFAALLFGLGALHAAAPDARALQIVEARDGVAVEALLSIKEPTRIRIDGAPIVDVVGNVTAGGCGSGTPGPGVGAPLSAPTPASNAEVLVECDRDKGEIYLRPIGTSTKPVNLFVASAHATYTLVLRRSDTPADTIVIRDPTRSTGMSASAPASSANHVRGLKSMLVAMSQDRLPGDVRMEEVNRPVLLWNEARFTLLRRYEGRGLVGEKYLLQNVSGGDMVLAEPEFDRPDSGPGGRVIGVAVENPVLRPLETTHVFVIRRGGEK